MADPFPLAPSLWAATAPPAVPTPPLEGSVTADGVHYRWGSWADILEPEPGTTSLATYSDQFYAGKSAAVTHKVGKGSVTYIGVDTASGDLEIALLRKIYGATAPAALKPDFLVDWRDGFWVATNFTSLPQNIPAASTAHLLLGARTVPPGGVTVWQD